jgi:hypothetical protein
MSPSYFLVHSLARFAATFTRCPCGAELDVRIEGGRCFRPVQAGP